MRINNRCRWAGCTAIISPDLQLQPRSPEGLNSWTPTEPCKCIYSLKAFSPARCRLLCSAAKGDTHFIALEIIFSCTRDLEIANGASPSSLFYFLFRLLLDKYSSKASFIVISQRKCSPVSCVWTHLYYISRLIR